MSLCIDLVEQILCLFLMALGGFIVSKVGLVRPQESKILSVISVFIFTPCMLFGSFLIQWTPEKLSGIFLAFFSSVLVHGIYLIMTVLIRRRVPMTDIDAVSIVFTNAGNIMIPLIAGTLGHEYIFYTSAYMVVQNLLLWSYGIKVIGKQDRFQLRRVITNPVIIAIFLGILTIFFPIALPTPLEDTIHSLGACMAPVSMILVGILFAGMDRKKLKLLKGLWRSVVLRLLVYPLVILILLALLSRPIHHPDTWQILFVILLASAGPSASQVVQVSQLYDNESERASCINMITTLFCAVTLPVFALLSQFFLA